MTSACHEQKHLLFVLAVVVGCEETDPGDSGDMNNDSAAASGDSSPESGVDSSSNGVCRESCDDLLLFDCLTADEHEMCYDTCANRSAQDVEIFRACVSNTLPACSECYENFVDADPPDPTDGNSGDPPPSSCVDACEVLVECELEFEVEFASCDQFCGLLNGAMQEIFVECVQERDGCTLPEYCTSSSGDEG